MRYAGCAFMGSRFSERQGRYCRDRCVADLDISGKGYSLNCSEYTEQEHVSCYICDVYYSFYKKEVL